MFKNLRASIGTKIVFPYLLLTLAVAGVGAFVVTRLVTNSWQERFTNQLLETGRVVSETMVNFEGERLEVLRVVANTEGVPESLVNQDQSGLAERVPQIIFNSNTDMVEILDTQGQEVYGWWRLPEGGAALGQERSGADFSLFPDVRTVLAGSADEFGEKRILLISFRENERQSPKMVLFTIGPVYLDGEIVGAAAVGTYLDRIVRDLTETAVARVTLYDTHGNVLDTSFAGGIHGNQELQELPSQYQLITDRLKAESGLHPVVVSKADSEVPLRQVEVLEQEYWLAYGDWRLRGQSLGLFSVGLPSSFLVSTAATSRNFLAILFSLATIAVFALGFVIAQRIIKPLQRLAFTSVAVAQGDLTQRTGIRRDDEIGNVAHSFDIMTDRLVERNRQLIEQASKLEAILDSTADGIIVLDHQGLIISTNPAAQRILLETSSELLADIMREVPSVPLIGQNNGPGGAQSVELALMHQPQRYTIGNRVYSALMSSMKTPEGEVLGTVVALRDVSREAEAERLKDSFIKGISHDLRTPLTAIKGYSDLLLLTANGDLSDRQLRSVQTISQHTDYLLHHINEIIDISLIQAGNLRLERKQLNFTQLIGDIAEKWRQPIAVKGISYQVSLPQTDLWVDGDEKRLAWAVDNLLSNAHNYTLTGKINVNLCQAPEELRLDVIDTGIGVDVTDQPFLFTRFFRAASHEAVFDVAGVGLGLYITRSLVELHQGRVWAASKPGVGSTFSLALPLVGKQQIVS